MCQPPACLTLGVVSDFSPSPYATSGPVVVAHRGGAGIAPENTLEACLRSLELGITHLELDVQQTSDGVLVAFHDSGTRRVTGRSGSIKRRTWAEVQRLSVGEGRRIPRLDDLLEAMPEARFMLDLKDDAALGPLVTLIKRTRAVRRVCLTGTFDAVLADARALLGPALATSMGFESMGRLMVAARTGRRARGVVAAPYLHVPMRWGYVQVMRNPYLAGRVVDLAAGFAASVMVWTVDDPATTERLFAAGVTGVITDRPDVVRAAGSVRAGQSSTITGTGPACPTMTLPAPAAAFSGI